MANKLNQPSTPPKKKRPEDRSLMEEHRRIMQQCAKLSVVERALRHAL